MALRRFIVAITASCFVGLGLQAPASAAVIGTQELLAAEVRAGHLADITTSIQRADVQAQLIALGVDPADAVERAAALSNAELARLATQIEALPAGGDSALAVIGIVFLVLLILEVTGVTDIFKRI